MAMSTGSCCIRSRHGSANLRASHALPKKRVPHLTFGSQHPFDSAGERIKDLDECPASIRRLCHESKHMGELISKLYLWLANPIFFHFWKEVAGGHNWALHLKYSCSRTFTLSLCVHVFFLQILAQLDMLSLAQWTPIPHIHGTPVLPTNVRLVPITCFG